MSFVMLSRKILQLSRSKQISLGRRLFLSEAYRCQEAWDRRFEAPILQRIKLEDFYQGIDQKFNTEGKASAIDVDLFANAVSSDLYTDELSDILHKLRLCPNTTDTLPSTHHAVIRYYLALGNYSELLQILNDRLNYGIFPDDYSTALLMDTFLKQKLYTEAAKVAALQMLQEDWSDPVVAHLALYSCHMYLRHPGVWEEPQESESGDDTEEVKVRVAFIRNPYFDDHFDLRNPKFLVGKTLATLGTVFPDEVGRTYQLLGWGMYQKWDRAISLLEQVLKEQQKPALIREGVDKFKETLAELKVEDASAAETKEKLTKLLKDVESSPGLVADLDIHEKLEERVKAVVSKNEQSLIENQCKVFSEWEAQRELLLQQQVNEFQRQQRLAKVQEEKEKLAQRESVLFFFDNEEKWELKIEEKEKQQNEKLEKKKTKKSEDADYIPPEVTKSHNLM